ncbi:MAG: hypothetical protein R3D65_03910 [Zhengella sp.]|uniref:hypothetical protein n=1 Tax=Zhengella sp. TaxID=2282762 RepID=UPI001E0F93CC|nr:hypothetical protein [Notoacmeibacter sp.]MCC0026113.1 hypothetical protein [Brucellaceae bacterium]
MVLSNYLWFVAVALGPVLLGAVFIFVMMKRRRLSRNERAKQERKVHDLYDGPS